MPTRAAPDEEPTKNMRRRNSAKLTAMTSVLRKSRVEMPEEPQPTSQPASATTTPRDSPRRSSSVLGRLFKKKEKANAEPGSEEAEVEIAVNGFTERLMANVVARVEAEEAKEVEEEEPRARRLSAPSDETLAWLESQGDADWGKVEVVSDTPKLEQAVNEFVDTPKLEQAVNEFVAGAFAEAVRLMETQQEEAFDATVEDLVARTMATAKAGVLTEAVEVADAPAKPPKQPDQLARLLSCITSLQSCFEAGPGKPTQVA